MTINAGACIVRLWEAGARAQAVELARSVGGEIEEGMTALIDSWEWMVVAETDRDEVYALAAQWDATEGDVEHAEEELDRASDHYTSELQRMSELR